MFRNLAVRPGNKPVIQPGKAGTVNLKDLGLKGSIWSGNSKPTISVESVPGIQFLDNYLTNKGYNITYTSAMGGKHMPKSGHYLGHKIDLQITKNGKPARLSPQDEQYLSQMGFVGKGAVGWETVPGQVGGGHYDLNTFEASRIINKYKG